MTVKNIREMLLGDAHPDEAYTMQAFLDERHEERVVHEDPNAAYTGRLPGGEPEEEHPLAHTAPNPIPGVSVQGLVAALRDGSIEDQGLRRRVASYIQQYEKWSGEKVTDTQHHVEGAPRVNQGQIGLRRHGW
jgi:hypothetical protein